MWDEHGYEPPSDTEVVCPVCGQDCRWFYRNFNGEILGCEECVEEVSADDYLAEQGESHEIERGIHWNE